MGLINCEFLAADAKANEANKAMSLICLARLMQWELRMKLRDLSSRDLQKPLGEFKNIKFLLVSKC
jgi:hypothetical protein